MINLINKTEFYSHIIKILNLSFNLTIHSTIILSPVLLFINFSKKMSHRLKYLIIILVIVSLVTAPFFLRLINQMQSTLPMTQRSLSNSSQTSKSNYSSLNSFNSSKELPLTADSIKLYGYLFIFWLSGFVIMIPL